MTTAPVKEQLRPLNANPLEMFVIQYLAKYLKCKVPPVHREIYDILCDNSNLRFWIDIFRGSGKTNIASFFYPMYVICETQHEYLQIFSASGGDEGLSTKISRRIKKEIEENLLLRLEYGITPIKPWGNKIFRIRRADGTEIEIASHGKGSKARGNRGIVIVDDPQDLDDVRSETILERDERWFLGDVLPILEQDQRCIFIGTALSPKGLLSKIKKKTGWKGIERPVDDPVGSLNSIWPEHHSREYLQQQLDDMGLDIFNAEYRCKPLVSGNPIFREGWLSNRYTTNGDKYLRASDRGLFTVIGVDTAISKRRVNDQSALVAVSAPIVDDPDYFVVKSKKDRLSNEDLALKLLNWYKQLKPGCIFVEAACNPPDEDGVIEWIKNKSRIHNEPGLFDVLTWAHPTESKVHRAFRVQPMFQNGKVYFCDGDEDQAELVEDLRLFTGDDQDDDDAVDAIVHALRQFQERAWKPRRPLYDPNAHRTMADEFTGF